MQRRHFLQCASGLLLAAGTGAAFGAAAPKAGHEPDWNARLRALEKPTGGRLGVAAIDTGSGQSMQWRGDERFRMCSSFKYLLAAAVLRQVELGKLTLDRKVPITAADMISHAPFTQPLVGSSATVAQLCEATTTLSDNPAANLLLPLVGGPQGLTRFLRDIGDTVTRCDRTEPELNRGAADDPRDTSSPLAQVATMRALLLGDALKPASREQLTAWLVANKTGDKRLRAGLPAGVRVGDKTGTAGEANNDVGIVWPPGRAPILIVSYLQTAKLDDAARDAVHAQVARLVYSAWGGAAA
ncbi:MULTISPECIES: class A beta-lactamase [Lysobacter]|uniref:beta-lactamase n=1 Tax=Lysobacter gummosus TaxID=262324 RepID=A0ABY3XBC6_9GAMM|nr:MULTISPECIES: class A beta-lactamase [Lysobacter]ALN93307.1 beta-lactamase CTX-M-27 [Lysobacter gummosus]UJB19965.1 class A beta-lactamase [Lysobacter capsici]UJQ30920.1 class A beta-lactamase [Lysobacter gummosus]UNP28794.1 class A beta-lactamase [Lysobacter gummosus]